MKRGIAIGVAASTCIILIALLAAFAVHRRKMLTAQLAQAQRPNPTPGLIEEKQCLSIRTQEKLPISLPRDEPPHVAPLEAETRPIFELDGDPAELPTKDASRRVQELDGASLPAYWDLKIEKQNARAPVARQPTLRGGPLRLVPVLHVSPPEVSPLEGTILLTGGVSPLASSPGAISPLQEVYSPMTPRAPRGWI